jgi:hypothetical protein
MRALLKPDIARDMGIVLLRPGRELMHIFTSGRVLVERQPENMADLPSGAVPPARQMLIDDPALSRSSLTRRLLMRLVVLMGLRPGYGAAVKSASGRTQLITTKSWLRIAMLAALHCFAGTAITSCVKPPARNWIKS